MRLCPVCIVAAAAAVGSVGFLALGGAGTKPVAIVSPAQAADGEYKVDGLHSSAMFRVKHQGVAYFYGRFNKISGSFTIDAAKPEATMIDAKVDVDSIDTNSTGRDTHLKGQEFFSAKEFAEITFKSTSAKKGEGSKIAVTGDFTMHGVTKPITIQVDATGQGKGRGGPIAGLETSAVIKRSDFGMKFMLDALGDEVTIYISLEGGKK